MPARCFRDPDGNAYEMTCCEYEGVAGLTGRGGA